MKLGYLLTTEVILLIIDVDNLDFQQNKEDLGLIINKIDAEISKFFINM